MMFYETASELIKRWEGLRLNRYLCPAGVPTIGYGHTSGMLPSRININQAEQYLQDDIVKHYLLMLRSSPVMIAESANRQAAILSFIFNLGIGNYNASTLKRRIDKNRWDDVPDQLDRWIFAGGIKLPGLIARRKAEAYLI